MPAVLDSAVLVMALFRARAGWRRGFVSQLLDMSGFLMAAILAWRFWCVLAKPWASVAGLSDGWASIAGAATVFVPVIALVAVLGWKLGRITRQPGLNMTNRLLGAALAIVVAAVALSFLQLVVRLSPLPGVEALPAGPLSRAPVAAVILGIAEPVARTVAAVAQAVVPGGCRGG